MSPGPFGIRSMLTLLAGTPSDQTTVPDIGDPHIVPAPGEYAHCWASGAAAAADGAANGSMPIARLLSKRSMLNRCDFANQLEGGCAAVRRCASCARRAMSWTCRLMDLSFPRSV